jgi:hypothetical protein
MKINESIVLGQPSEHGLEPESDATTSKMPHLLADQEMQLVLNGADFLADAEIVVPVMLDSVEFEGFVESDEQESGRETLIGRSDRSHHLAMHGAADTSSLRSSKMGKSGQIVIKKLDVVLPQTREECERHCGFDGVCDPTSEFGCGGKYCEYLA